MINHIAIAALAVDVAGAILLARALAFEGIEQYVAAHGTATWEYNASADVARVRDRVDARVGLGLIVIGFVGQGIAAAASGSGWIAACIAYSGAVAIVAAGRAVLPRLRRADELPLIRERLLRNPGDATHCLAVLTSYSDSLAATPRSRRPGEDPRRWADRIFGPGIFAGVPGADLGSD